MSQSTNQHSVNPLNESATQFLYRKNVTTPYNSNAWTFAWLADFSLETAFAAASRQALGISATVRAIVQLSTGDFSREPVIPEATQVASVIPCACTFIAFIVLRFKRLREWFYPPDATLQTQTSSLSTSPEAIPETHVQMSTAIEGIRENHPANLSLQPMFQSTTAISPPEAMAENDPPSESRKFLAKYSSLLLKLITLLNLPFTTLYTYSSLVYLFTLIGAGPWLAPLLALKFTHAFMVQFWTFNCKTAFSNADKWRAMVEQKTLDPVKAAWTVLMLLPFILSSGFVNFFGPSITISRLPEFIRAIFELPNVFTWFTYVNCAIGFFVPFTTAIGSVYNKREEMNLLKDNGWGSFFKTVYILGLVDTLLAGVAAFSGNFSTIGKISHEYLNQVFQLVLDTVSSFFSMFSVDLSILSNLSHETINEMVNVVCALLCSLSVMLYTWQFSIKGGLGMLNKEVVAEKTAQSSSIYRNGSTVFDHSRGNAQDRQAESSIVIPSSILVIPSRTLV